MFYGASAHHSDQAVITGGIAMAFSMAGASIFTALTARPVDQRLVLAGYRPYELLLGRLLLPELFGIEVPPGVVHDWWNIGDDEAHVLVDMRPAARFELMIQNLYGLANDGKANARGVPRLLPLALFAREFRREGEFIRPPRLVQRVLFGALGPLAQARGYKAVNPDYLGPTGKAAARR